MTLLVFGTLIVCMAVLLTFSEWGTRSSLRGDVVVAMFAIGIIAGLVGTGTLISAQEDQWLTAKTLIACYGAVIISFGMGMVISMARSN